MGHDYYHFFVRLCLGALHFWQNGWDVPHYTPLIVGGIPFFADPQAIYYSFPQFLFLYFPPLWSLGGTVVVFYLLGYWGFLKLAREAYGMSDLVAHFCALLFILNGYSFSQLLMGHVTHHSYLLFPWLLYGFLGSAPFLLRLIPFSFALIYAFYSGGMHVLVIFAAGLFLFLPAHFTLRRLYFIAGAAVILGLTCSGKFMASYLFSKSFYIAEIDPAPWSLPQFLYQYFWFHPGSTPPYTIFGRWNFGAWEYVGFLSKITLGGLFAFIWMDRKNARRWILFAVPALTVAVLASGTEMNSHLAFFRHYHNPTKMLAAFIPPLILMTGVSLNRVREKWEKLRWAPVAFFLISLILVAEFRYYVQFFNEINQPVHFTYQRKMFEALRERGRLAPIKMVQQQYNVEFPGLFQGLTSALNNEPLFGYRGEANRSKLEQGPTSLLRDGKFNLNHPGCFVYSSYFHCEPWDRISEENRDEFELFIRGKSAFGVPPWQSTLIHLNALAIVVFLISWLVLRIRSWVPPFMVFSSVPLPHPR